MPGHTISKTRTLNYIHRRLEEIVDEPEYFRTMDYWGKYELKFNKIEFYPRSMNDARTKWSGYKINTKTQKRTEVKAGSIETLIENCQFLVGCRAGRWVERQQQRERIQNEAPAERYARVITGDQIRMMGAGPMTFQMLERLARTGAPAPREPEEAPPVYAEEDPLAPPAYTE